MRTSDEHVFAIGEVALHAGTIYGLVAPGYEMAGVLARHLTGHDAAFLGAASEREIALHIARSHGPSGANRDYLLRLAEALRELGADDPHVFAIERELLLAKDTIAISR